LYSTAAHDVMKPVLVSHVGEKTRPRIAEYSAMG
jgi:hypothetical protein